MLESNDVDQLASRACCPEVIEDITEGDVLEEGGFVFKTNHPCFFHAGENECLPEALGGLDGRLAIELARASYFPGLGARSCCRRPESRVRRDQVLRQNVENLVFVCRLVVDFGED